MQEGRINLSSDTQTRPTAAMRRAMAEAEVGDEQLGLDPTVTQLCRRAAALLGQEAAVLLPSGTMCNVISVLVHCRPGDELYAHHTAHVVSFEGGGAAVFAGVQSRPLEGGRGIFTAETLRGVLRPVSRYAPCSRLAVIEQTTNLGGGTVWSEAEIAAVATVAGEHGLRLHLDGARLLNAAVALGVEPRRLCAPFDSVWIDLSKGLGCPVGAVLAGPASFIEAAWGWKQRLGGSMRQAGVLAAAGLHALTHHVERLADDHANARRFWEIVRRCPGVELAGGVPSVESNIVCLDLAGSGVPAQAVADRLEQRGVNVGVFGEHLLRAVTHLGVGRAQVEKAAAALAETVEELGR